MTAEIDTVLDRRRLRRRLTVWRVLAVAAVVAALFAFSAGSDQWSAFGTKQIARVAISGTITEDRDQLELLKKIAESDNAAALLVFVNSPGGTTTGGEALFAALREVAKKKPVVAQFGTVAASAGYIVGLGADHIVTRANTITGSVGVLVQWPEVSQMLDKLGVKFNEIKSGSLKAVPSPFEPLSEEGQKVTQSMIDEGFRWFLGLVEQRRGIKPDDIPGLTQGRVFTGREAVQLKLADSIGGEEEAVEWLRTVRNVDKSLKVVDWKPQSAGSLGLFSSLGTAAASFFNNTSLGQMLARDPSLSGLGLDGLISVWHPSEK
ncbi:MAG: signal peptide peptidase SppA [Hyphomicrobium sp.]|uniref:signal peptide peptidase SppA n=1 Tax=Hyphomicrobium sp. TaxID=82 RepID=UPI0013291C18|nr:signal peptide peptidase SppA [Hyphomicrobium sp.]KAB2939782.1 MAG: signal peptide peptidase SppA [Hyphomicrobium sp.]MBZ0208173.1 signal peptide peptidase SppA [Hyphomicrobium sp.]